MKWLRWLAFAGASLLVAGVVVTAHWPVSTTPTTPVPMNNVTVYAFSQSNPGDDDPQVLQLVPDIVMRGWQRWDRGGLKASDYDTAYLQACHNAGILFIGGSTATVLFPTSAWMVSTSTKSAAPTRAQTTTETKASTIITSPTSLRFKHRCRIFPPASRASSASRADSGGVAPGRQLQLPHMAGAERLAALWGRSGGNHPAPAATHFVDQAEPRPGRRFPGTGTAGACFGT